ncbi:tkl drk protein kinase [Plasmopara halstedii]|uniref:Tkl drk protein kinase n=1 Tax=Plasmopara halstedii TaxID=4781 RepID=A0A0P1ABA3_PLAHL|nr:tkl drk protein kinase [Plasmopara halstedii]CEG38184.1 tkl drk protein kinase [Plasmopara halstedii]|eukprot:XP_024574553.1 tkl drk protein kinase [Plasmopara halstedii]
MHRPDLLGAYSQVETPQRVIDEQNVHHEVRTLSCLSESSFHSSSSCLCDEESSQTPCEIELLSTRDSASWQAHMDPSVDLKLLTNHFRDERMEESYQLYSSTVDFPVARRLMLALVAFEGAAYFLLHKSRNTCIAPSGNDYDWVQLFASLLNEEPLIAYEDNEGKCVTLTEGTSKDVGLTWLLWSFAPFAVIYGLSPIKYFEGTMRLRIGVYYIRRHWKVLASLIILCWFVGLAVFIHHELVQFRINLQRSLAHGMVCTVDTRMPISWYDTSNWGEGQMTLLSWLQLYVSKLAYSLLMGVLAVLAAFAGIVAVAMKLDFTHVLLLAVAAWTTTLLLCFVGATPLISSSQRVMSNEAFLFFLCVFLPTCFTLTATYSEDRAARMAYASKVRAERINTTLKLDLSVKQIGLENCNAMTRDEEILLERALSASGDMELIRTVAIPFADLKLKKIIAKTPNGEVLVGEYHQTEVVVKRLAQSCLTVEGLAAFKSNVELLACLRHPNIVLFIGATFDNLSNVGFVMEYLERGDVLSLLRSSIALAWSDPLLKIATDVAQGVSYLHNCDPPLVHRDLKSSNLLCTHTYSCKVSDFGESKQQLLPGRLFSTIVGTPYWLAPEILREERYDTQVDCYSFGVILVELETRREPYHDVPKDFTTIDIMMGVSRGNLRPTIPPSCLPNRRELIMRCLNVDPKCRPKMTEILYALQHDVRQELLDQNSTDIVSDKRRMVLMQQHQRLNRRGLQDLMRVHNND